MAILIPNPIINPISRLLFEALIVERIRNIVLNKKPLHFIISNTASPFIYNGNIRSVKIICIGIMALKPQANQNAGIVIKRNPMIGGKSSLFHARETPKKNERRNKKNTSKGRTGTRRMRIELINII